MALKFHPNPGTVLVCDYNTGFIEPEMTKSRPVIVISPKFKGRNNLCAVVPFSTSPPQTICAYHHKVVFNPPLPEPFDSPEMWVKGDMLVTVCFDRLNLIQTKRDQYGKRKYLQPKLEKADLEAVYCAVLNGLGLGRLTPHL